ncbi:MAG: T9SS type A sorting domain-containing protein [Candidatus Desantisbacteria bacterium]
MIQTTDTVEVIDLQQLFINPRLILYVMGACLWCVSMLFTPLVCAEPAPAGIAITNGGDNGTAVFVDGVNQPGDVILRYNNKAITCQPTTLIVGQVHEIGMTNTTGQIQNIPIGSPIYYHYQTTNTGNGADNIHLSAQIITATGGTWTALLVENQQDIAIISPKNLEPNQTLSFSLKVIPPSGVISGSCTVKVTAADSYFQAHTINDGWPQGQDADMRQDVVTTIIIPPITEEHGGEVKSTDKIAEVIIPPAAMPEDVYVNIIPITATATAVSEGMIAAILDPFIEPIPGTVTYEFVAKTVGTQSQAVKQFNTNVTISISYPDINQDGLVDGTNIPETTLRLFRLNEQTQRFEIIPDSWVEPEANRVGANVDHFSYYSVLAYTPKVMGISEVVNYPNPFDMTTVNYMTFGPLPLNENVVIEIYTLDGEIVQTLNAQNGTCQWDGRNSDGDKVSSGMYIYMVKMKAERKIGKMTVIR